MGNVCFKGGDENDPAVRYRPGESVDGKVDLGRDSISSARSEWSRSLPSIPLLTRVRALYNFDAINQDDLSFRKGDLMELEKASPDDDDWWMATHLITKEKGYIPSNYVAIDNSDPRNQDWWFVEFDRKESDKMLLMPGNPRGTFLVRDSTDRVSYVLSVRDTEKPTSEPCVKHYRIRKLDDDRGFYISAKKHHLTLVSLIAHYKEAADGLCCKLDGACPRSRPAVQFRDLEIRRELVELSHKLGSGFFGDVWNGKLRKVVDVAVKTLIKGTMTSDAFLDEAKIMHKLTHPKLVQIMAVVSLEEPFLIITELMSNGSLLDFLRQSTSGQNLSFENVVDMNCQIAEGMAYLEKENYVHRDLRAANILVGENNEVKVADFGLARILDNDDNVYNANDKARFPVKWTSPEAALRRQFSVKSDVWSFGVLMYEVITIGGVPYPGMTGQDVLRHVESGGRMNRPARGYLEKEDHYWAQMIRCWDTAPEARPTFEYLRDFFDTYAIGTEEKYKEIA